jgi:hypothetical protein
VAFLRNSTGKVVYDRRFNTTALLASYYSSNVDFAGRIQWVPDDPNSLKLILPDGLIISSRVLRRSEQQIAKDRFETSEFLQQVGWAWVALMARGMWMNATAGLLHALSVCVHAYLQHFAPAGLTLGCCLAGCDVLSPACCRCLMTAP